MRKIICIFIILICAVSLNAQTLSAKLNDSIRKDHIEKAKKNGIPLCFIDVEVTYNIIGNPEVNVIPQNVSSKGIDAYTIQVYCYDNFNKPVNHNLKQTNLFSAISQDYQAPYRDNYLASTWTLYGHENTTKVKVYLVKVHFWDGTTWTPKDKKLTQLNSW